MIFFARDWGGQSWADPLRGATSLGLFAGCSVESGRDGNNFFAELTGLQKGRRRFWTVPRSPSGWPLLFNGWIDNRSQLCDLLGVGSSDAAKIYGAAVERWGDEADTKIIGTYAAIVDLPDGSVRLSRSPWSSKPLFYFADNDVLLASSVARPIFAAGAPRLLRTESIDLLLAMEQPDLILSDFTGISRVQQGSVVHLGRGTRRIVEWYDPFSMSDVRFRTDQDYVDAANAILAEAVRSAMAVDGKVGMSLSGGLDSPIVCDEMLRQMPTGERLTGFTFHPLSTWDGKLQSHKFGDDRPFVEDFAAKHPALDTIFVDNNGIGYEDRSEQIFLAGGGGFPARMLGTVRHGVYDAARAHGCEWVFSADFGNLTFSSDAPWAYSEFFRRGQWRQLWLMAAARLNDPRPIWRRIASHSVMPQMPPQLRRSIRSALHRDRGASMFANPFLRADSRLARFREPENLSRSIMPVDEAATRADHIRRQYAGCGLGAEMIAADEQVFGVRIRDVTAYRPLIEFCNAIPTGQFVHNGETRWLARRMAIGRMPEAQRTNRLYGEHNVDWHARMTPRIPELRRQVEAIADHPQIGPVIDVDLALQTLDKWPSETPDDQELAGRLRFFLPAVLHITRYVDFMTGRNSGAPALDSE